MAPIPSVTRRPTASRFGPSTIAMKSNGPVMPSRCTIVDGPLLILDNDFFTTLALPAAVSMSTYAFTRFPAVALVIGYPFRRGTA